MIYVLLYLVLGFVSAIIFYLKFDDIVGAEGWESSSSTFMLQVLIYPCYWLKIAVVLLIYYLERFKK